MFGQQNIYKYLIKSPYMYYNTNTKNMKTFFLHVHKHMKVAISLKERKWIWI